MTSYKITFAGTDEQLLMGAEANGFTGLKPLPPIIDVPVEQEEETLDEFMVRILMTVSPKQFIDNAVTAIQKKKGTDNYDAEAMATAMLGLLSIEPIVL